MQLPTTMTELLEWRCATYVESKVVDQAGRTRSGVDWLERVPRIAAGLEASGVRAGDHVAIWASNSLAWLELWFAVAWLDAVLVPLNTRISAAELDYVLDHGDVRRLVWEPLGALADEQAVADVLPPGALAMRLPADAVDPWADLVTETAIPSKETADRIGMIQYTSGSTGSPKGVMLRASAMIRNAAGLARAWQVTRDDVVLCANPLFHNGGAVFSHLAAVAGGADLVLMRRWNPPEAVDLVERHRITVFPTIDTMLRDLLVREQDRARLQSLRVVSTAGSRVLFEAVREAWDCRPSNVFGMTETSPNVCVGDLDDDDLTRLEWIGRPQEGLELELRDDSGVPVPVGSIGEIHVRGWTVTPGYYGDPGATAATIGADGFLRSGDLGRLSPDGRLAYAGRLKRMAKSGGENVSLLEVEEAIRAYSGVDDVGVVAVPHERYGEALVAYVTGALPPDEEASLIAFLRDRIAHYKVPQRVFVEGTLPRTGSEKVDYVALAARARDHGELTIHPPSAVAGS
jgi:fatty-acyl-CoA synthase